jgi:thiamine biosynthesis lipoprotein
MGTVYTVKVADQNIAPADFTGLARAIQQRLASINSQMSTYDSSSEISQFNRLPAHKTFQASPELLHVLRAALATAQSSAGAFDPTIGPLVEAWGFGVKKRDEPPTDIEVRKLKSRVGWQALHLGKSSLKKSVSGLHLDLSAIAKGYAVDELARVLKTLGYKDYMVEIGGEVVAQGRNARGDIWRLGIERPDSEAIGGSIGRTISLQGGLATSGSYRNFYRKNGRSYSHFIDPRTGAPVTHSLLSVSVVAPRCMDADAAATTVMVLGPDEGRTWLVQQGYAGLLITTAADGSYRYEAVGDFPAD